MLFRYYLQIGILDPSNRFSRKRKVFPSAIIPSILNIRLFILIKTFIAKIPSFQFLDNNLEQPVLTMQKKNREKKEGRDEKWHEWRREGIYMDNLGNMKSLENCQIVCNNAALATGPQPGL